MTRLGVPAYFHPSWAGADWERLTRDTGPDPVGIVVLNPDSGPGAGPDEAYRAVCASARRPGRCVAGYVASGYARRPVAEVVAEADAYRRFYGLDAVFVDEVSSGAGDLLHYRRLAGALRRHGAAELILNPGVVPDPGYHDLADVVVEFEGDAGAYRRFVRHTPERGAGAGGARRWHLVHGVPAPEHATTIGWARRSGAEYVYVTDRGMPDPWDGLPSTWPALVEGPGGGTRRR